MISIHVSTYVLPLDRVVSWIETGQGPVDHQPLLNINVPATARPLDVIRLCLTQALGFLETYIAGQGMVRCNPYARGLATGMHLIAIVGTIPDGMMALSPTTLPQDADTILTSRRALQTLVMVPAQTTLRAVLSSLPWERAVPYGMAYPLDQAVLDQPISQCYRQRAWMRVTPAPEPLVDGMAALQLGSSAVTSA